MPLPEQVVAQLGRETTSQTPGWSFGIISFSAGIFLIMVFLWAGLTFGYKPYLDNQTSNVEDSINTLNQSISPTDQANLISFYSQLSNLRTLLAARSPVSNIFPWLEANTEANVFYTAFSLSQNQLTLGVQAESEADANQQIAIFETSPEIENLQVSGITMTTAANGASNWQFSASITLDPSVFTTVATTASSTTP